MRVLRHTEALCTCAGILFCAMTLLELVYFRSLSGGIMSVDMRPLGFTPDDGFEWTTALGPRGSETVIVWHYLTFDLLFPALFGLALASLIIRLGMNFPRFRKLPPRIRDGFGLALAAPGVLADYAQNFAVTRILSNPLNATPESWTVASGLIVTKFALYAVPLAVIVAFLLASRKYVK